MNKLLKHILTFALAAPFACHSFATIETQRGESHSIYPDFIGVNANLSSIPSPWDNPGLVEGATKIAVGNIRYPGGTIGNTWDWSIGWVDQDVAEGDLIKWVVENNIQQSSNRYTLENLAQGLKTTKASAVFMLNMLTKDLEHSINALKKARDLGIEVKYVELGNELYFNIPLEMRIFPTSDDLGKTSQRWIKALKKEFPEAKYAVVGTNIRRRERHEDWNERMLKHAKDADAITLHMYTPFSLFGNHEIKNYTAGTEGTTSDSDNLTALTLAERQKLELNALNDQPTFTNMLTNVVEKNKEIKMMNVPDSIDIWVTEFNVRGDDSAVRGSWANALVLSVFYDQFLQHKQVKLSNVHNLIGNVWEMVYLDNPLHHVVNPKAFRKPNSVSAGGLATHYFAKAMAGQTQVTPIVFKDVPKMHDTQGKVFPALSGYLFNGDRKTGIIINYSNSVETISLDFIEGGAINFEQTSARLQHYVMDEDRMEKSTGTAQNTIQLASHSITTFTYR